jgi:hypothetical protein
MMPHIRFVWAWTLPRACARSLLLTFIGAAINHVDSLVADRLDR